MMSYGRCSVCGKTLEAADGYCLVTHFIIGGNPVCEECAKKMEGRCPVCGDVKGWCGHTRKKQDKEEGV